MAGNVKYEYQKLKQEEGFEWSEVCNDEEARYCQNSLSNSMPLPGNVTMEGGRFIKHFNSGLSDAEKQEYLSLKRSKDLRIIKNCVIFFTVIVAIALTIGVIALLMLAQGCSSCSLSSF